MGQPRLAIALLFSCSFDSFVDGFAAGESFFGRMPVGDFFLAKLPAEQNDFTVDAAGKVEQADIDVFDLYAGGVNLGDRVFGALHRALALGAAARDSYYVHQRSAV